MVILLNVTLSFIRDHEQDLDPNLEKVDKIVKKRLEQQGITIKVDPKRQNRFTGNIAATPQVRHAVHLDLAIQPDLSALLPFTITVDGVVVADHSLLLVDKIFTASQRPFSNSKKIITDLGDVYFCASELYERQKKVPVAEILRSRLTEKVMRSFWERVWEFGGRELGDRGAYEDILRLVGLLEGEE